MTNYFFKNKIFLTNSFFKTKNLFLILTKRFYGKKKQLCKKTFLEKFENNLVFQSF